MGDQDDIDDDPPAWLSGAWARRWPGRQPIAHTLRGSEEWIRFHSLPGSRRYARDEAEHAEILRRHRIVLGELVERGREPVRDLLVVTCSWSASPVPEPRSAPVAGTCPAARYWVSVTDEEPDIVDDCIWTHLYVDSVDLDDPRLDRLLRIVADDRAAGVLILPPDLGWLYHPYDGGADVYPATLDHRAELAAAHADWLSSSASGL